MPTLSALQSAGARVWWQCQECRATGDVDLARVIAAKGPDYDLTDRTAACPAKGCTYWVNFYAQGGMRNTPLRTEAGLMREMERRSAWLTAKWLAEGKTIHGREPDPAGACPAALRTDDAEAGDRSLALHGTAIKEEHGVKLERVHDPKGDRDHYRISSRRKWADRVRLSRDDAEQVWAAEVEASKADPRVAKILAAGL